MDPPQPPVKRKRGRPRKTEVIAREEGPLWAIVDQLTLIHDDLKQLLEEARKCGPAVPEGALHG